jgi:hypothetical protein
MLDNVQALKYLLQRRLHTKCPMILSLGRTYCMYMMMPNGNDLQFSLARK